MMWFAVIALRMGYLASGMSRKHRISSEMVSGRTYLLPALRGTIFDSDGKKLAWSEKHYDLIFLGTITDNEREELQEILAPRTISESPEIGDVVPSLAPAELMALENLLKNTPSLHIKSRLERVTVNDPAVKEKLGTLANGKGISGWEKEYDSILSGKDGSFYVSCDRQGRWLKNTGTIKNMPIPGRDVRVPFKFQKELTQK